ncbi:MAG: hypothetical protein GY895_13800 [Phycisphaera sp.]|nr:hypothetical protein [Phycisphaera sp.]
MTDHSNRDDLFTRRLESLEASLYRERLRRRRTEALLLGGLLIAASLGALAATGTSNVVDVVQTHRLEILDDNDQVVLLATAARHGGRVDVWDAAQRNIARLGGNGLGGDLTLFDRGGRQVAGMYATTRSARIEVNNPADGSAAVRLSTDEAGGRMIVSDDIGRPGARISASKGKGIISVGTPEQDQLVLEATDGGGRITARPDAGDVTTMLRGDGLHITSSIHTLASLEPAPGGGSLRLRDDRGEPRVEVRAEPIGGRIQTLDTDGLTRVAIGVGSGGTGLRVSNRDGASVLALGEDGDGSGVFEISDLEGNRCIAFGIGEIAGRMTISNRDGARMLDAGGGSSGGRLDVRDGEETVVATMRGIEDGGRIAVGIGAANVGVTIDVTKQGSPTLAIVTPSGRSVGIAGTPAGGLINLHDGAGDVVVAAGAVKDAPGGIVSIRNRSGEEVVRAGVKDEGQGVIEVYNESHTRKRSVSAP